MSAPKSLTKSLRFDEDICGKEDILSTAALQSLKGELDNYSALLATGRATDDDKKNAQALNASLRSASLMRSKAEEAKKTDTEALLESIKKNKAALSAKMDLLSKPMKDEERSRLKAECRSMKVALEDSMEINNIRKKLAKRTEANVGIETHINNNLESARRARKIVLCIMMDCTGSMQSCIDEVKNKIHDVTSQFAELYAEGNIHYAFLGYRDFGDSEQFQSFGFVSDVTEFQEYLQCVTADGGGDAAEDVVGALNKVKDLNWDVAGPGSSRMLIHVADAPPHGSEYHEADVSDDYADGDVPSGVEGKNATPPLRYLKAKRVHYYFCPPPGHTCAKMVEVFNSKLKRKYVEMRELADVCQLSETVLMTLSSSVLRTVHAGRSALSRKFSTLGGIGEEEDDGQSCISEPTSVSGFSRGDLSFSGLPENTVKVYQFKPPSTLSSLRAEFFPIKCQVMHGGRDGTTVMKWDPRAFGKGSVRWAFYGELKDGADFQPYVVKRLQGSHHTKASYMQGIEESMIARFLAEQYAHRRKPGRKAIRYLPAEVLEIQQTPCEYLFGEPQLPDLEFKKWANNASDWDLNHLDPSLLEFSKFTYDATEGYLMVADLQGVDTGAEFILTDPVVLCRNIRKYQPTNLGPDAMKANYERIKVLLARLLVEGY